MGIGSAESLLRSSTTLDPVAGTVTLCRWLVLDCGRGRGIRASGFDGFFHLPYGAAQRKEDFRMTISDPRNSEGRPGMTVGWRLTRPPSHAGGLRRRGHQRTGSVPQRS
jgi:hypothetical protein